MGATDKAIQTLFKLASEVKTLWKNASPESAFAEQRLPLQANDYDFTVVCCKGSLSAAGQTGGGTVVLGLNGESGQILTENSARIVRRAFNRDLDGKVYISDCVHINQYGQSASRVVSNNNTIPMIIYGIRLMGGAIRKIKECLKSLRFSFWERRCSEC